MNTQPIESHDEGQDDVLLDAFRPVPTGRLIARVREGLDTEGQRKTLAASGMTVQLAREAHLAASSGARVRLIEQVGIAVVEVAPEEDATAVSNTLMALDNVEDVRPEFWMFAIADPPASYRDVADATWGVQAVEALASDRTGEGIKVCILDTGIDLDHIDFRDRPIVHRSFVSGESVNDLQGHGTHCAGTAVGRRHQNFPGVPQRYGVAPDASLYIGKVLNDRGSGREADILDGMVWAVDQGCEVISMSLGRPVRRGEKPSLDYERVGQYALRNGSLILAAAGNDSARRFGFIAAVGAPADSPSIMAIGAVDSDLEMADFSNGGINSATGGEIDLAGPGVRVFSSVPSPENYKSLRGTSMACPHVAGVAALWAEHDASLRGSSLRKAIVDNARNLGHPQRDAGAGLAVAP